MKPEPRGFRYALEPLRSKCDWELQDLQQTLAELHRKIDDARQVILECQEQLSAATADLSRQSAESQVRYADRQNIAQNYIAQLSNRLRGWRKDLKELERQRDDTVAELHRLQKFADGLDDNRTEEMKEYAKTLGNTDMAETDDAWLRGMNRRKSQ